MGWAAGLAVAGFVVALAPVVAPVIKLVNGLAERGAAIAAEVDKADKDAVSLLLTQEAKLKKALAEAKALEEAELASARALARYIDPAGRRTRPGCCATCWRTIPTPRRWSATSA